MTVDEVLDKIKEWRRLVVNGVSINLDHLMLSECETLAAEVERLQAIVDKLPTTLDGVPLVPGMAIYYGPKDYSHCEVDAICSSGLLNMHGVGWDGETTNSWKQSCDFGYSTREAAEKARKA